MSHPHRTGNCAWGKDKHGPSLRDTGVECKELPRVAQGEDWWRRQCQDAGRQARHVPNTADCFMATVKVLRSMDPSEGVAFQTHSLPEDRCTRLLVKGLGKNMSEQDVREELEILGVPVKSVLQLHSQLRDPYIAKVPHTALHSDGSSRAPC